MNNENLRPFNHLAEDEAQAIRSKGGVARAEQARQKRELKERMQVALDTAISNPEILDMLKGHGLQGDGTYSDALCASLILSAIKGNANSAKLCLELVGEMPDQRVTVASEDAARVPVCIYLPDNGRD